MPLITCPDCQAEISDAASSCIKCGRPIAMAVKVERIDFVEPEKKSSKIGNVFLLLV